MELSQHKAGAGAGAVFKKSLESNPFFTIQWSRPITGPALIWITSSKDWARIRGPPVYFHVHEIPLFVPRQFPRGRQADEIS